MFYSRQATHIAMMKCPMMHLLLNPTTVRDMRCNIYYKLLAPPSRKGNLHHALKEAKFLDYTLSSYLENHADVLNWEICQRTILQTIDSKEDSIIFISHSGNNKERVNEIKRVLKRDLPGYSLIVSSSLMHHFQNILQMTCFNSSGNSLSTTTAIADFRVGSCYSALISSIMRFSAAYIYIPDDEDIKNSMMATLADKPWILHELCLSAILPGGRNTPILRTKNRLFGYEAPFNHLHKGSLSEFINNLQG